jgi:hypothetical protein
VVLIFSKARFERTLALPRLEEQESIARANIPLFAAPTPFCTV